MIDDIIGFLKGIGIVSPWGVVAAVIILYAVLRTDQFLATLGRVQQGLAWLGSGVERSGIAREIQGTLQAAGKQLNGIGPGILPERVKVEWVRDMSRDEFLKGDQVIVRIRHHANHDANLCLATLGYVRGGLLASVRTYIERQVMRATELKVTQKILVTSAPASLGYFNANVLPSEMKDDEAFRQCFSALGNIDHAGLFAHVFLSELLQLGASLYPSTHVPEDALLEAQRLVQWFDALATKSPAQALDFRGRYVSFSIVLVAIPYKYISFGETPYTQRIATCFQSRAERVYVLASGANTPLAAEVSAAFRAANPGARVRECRHVIAAPGQRRRPAAVCLVTLESPDGA